MDATTIHDRRWTILAVLCLSVFLAVVDNTIVNVALPTIQRDLGATTSDLQWIVDAYSLVFAALLFLGGSLGDRFGRKGALQLGLVWFALCSAVAGSTTSAGGLTLARAAMGIGAAFIFPATLAILTDVFRVPSERAKAIGIWSAVSGLAVAVGPVSGGWLLEHFSWGSIFYVNLPIAAFTLVAGALVVPTSKDGGAHRLDFVGLGLSTLGVAALVWTTIEAPEAGWTSTQTVAGYAASVILLVGFVLVELRREHPMLDVRVFSNARFSAASTSISIGFFCLFGFIFLVTQYFQYVRGYSPLSAGIHTLPFAVATGVFSSTAPRLAERFGIRNVVTLGLVVQSSGFALAAVLRADSAYWGPVVVSSVLIAAGLGLVISPCTNVIVGSLPREKAGVGSAVNDVTRELGGTLGVAVIGSVFSSLFGPRMIDALARFPLPTEVVEAASESIGAALSIAEQAGASQAAIIAGAQSAFMDGFSVGCWVAAGVSLAGSIISFSVLPRHLSALEVDTDGAEVATP